MSDRLTILAFVSSLVGVAALGLSLVNKTVENSRLKGEVLGTQAGINIVQSTSLLLLRENQEQIKKLAAENIRFRDAFLVLEIDPEEVLGNKKIEALPAPTPQAKHDTRIPPFKM